MPKKKKIRREKQNKHQQPDTAERQPKYEQMILEILFTDGQMETVTFYKLEDLVEFMDQTARSRYTDSMRVALF
ncbi:MAG: hypothetical protein JXB29_10025 [Sedimentisphaerales bacterium]|nr:hypothetical protein [Sedimentisphaerales bacterium]